MARKSKAKPAQSKDSFVVSMSIRVDGPTFDESQIIGRATKRAKVFENLFKDAKKVQLSEVTLKRV